MVPLVSICLPTLNARRFLKPRMDSIYSQTLTDWELIVCDSFSDDGTWEYLQQFKTDPRVRLYQVPKEGLYAGWNECLHRCLGSYVYIAPADDTMCPVALEMLVNPLAQLQDVDLAVCNFNYIGLDGECIRDRGVNSEEYLGDWALKPSLRSGYSEFIFHLCVGTLWTTMNALLFRRELLAKVGLFPTCYGSFGDLNWTLKATLASDVAWLPDKLVGFRIHDKQATPFRMLSRHLLLINKIQRDLLRDPHIALPTAWKTVPHWQDQLASVFLHRYLDSLELYRWNLRVNPARFMRNALSCFGNTPACFFHMLSRGFSVGCIDRYRVNPALHVYELLKTFDSPWPPHPLTA